MASLLPQPKQLVPDNAWNPGVSFQFFTYAAGTLTLKATYQDSALTILNTNPVVANARGEVLMFGDGAYRIILKDSLGNTVYDVDNIEGAGSLVTSFAASLAATGGSALVGYQSSTVKAFLDSILTTSVASIAALKAVSKTRYTYANVAQYYGVLGTTAPDGGGGFYFLDSSDTTTADNGGTVIVANDGGRWKLQAENYLSLKQFGAKGDNTTFDDTAINSWLAAIRATGLPGYAPKGTYRLSTRMGITLEGQITPGKRFRIFGDGPQNTMFNLTSAPTNEGPQFHVYVSTGGPTASYVELEDFNVYSSTPNVLGAFGLQDFSDNIGNMRCKNLTFGNDNAGTNAIAMQVNYCFDCVFENCVAVGKVGFGKALDLRRADFCTFIGGSYSNADYGIWFRDNVSRSNTFVGIDIENVNIGIRNDFAGIYNNMFVGGFADIWRPDLSAIGTWLVSSPVGTRGCIVLDNFHSTRVGVELYGGKYLDPSNPGAVMVRGYFGSATPSMPANGATISNTTGQTQNVIIRGGTVSSIFIRAENTTLTSGSFVLMPGDFIAIQYSVAPTWSWFPVW